MIQNETVLALITARGGSKRVPGKNIRPLGGKPLIAWTIEAAQKSRYVDRTILSSDDPEIIRVARAHGCDVPFVRPAELSGDRASSVDAGLHALSVLSESYHWLILLQPTSPFRTGEDIDACLALCVERGAESAISMCDPERSPYVMFKLDEQQRMIPAIPSNIDLQTARSQDFPPVYEINGAVYVTRVPWFVEHKANFGAESVVYVMPRVRSVNIDSEMDFALAEVIATRFLAPNS